MQFYAVLLPVATLLAATANAADCDSAYGAQNCVDYNDLLTARQAYCDSEYWGIDAKISFTGANGYHGTFTASNIPTQQACWDSTLDIIDQCLGQENGGSYSLDGWSVKINFCA